MNATEQENIKAKIAETETTITKMENGSLEHTETQLETMKWFLGELNSRLAQ